VLRFRKVDENGIPLFRALAVDYAREYTQRDLFKDLRFLAKARTAMMISSRSSRPRTR